MTKRQVTIVDVIRRATEIRRAEYVDRGLPEDSATLGGLASGVDVALSLVESSVGPFEGLDRNGAQKVVKYFRAESAKENARNVEISLFYSSFADAVEDFFLPQATR